VHMEDIGSDANDCEAHLCRVSTRGIW
jgi:hypothetical protein